MSNELVSVIIPCYNYAHFLPETLDSVQQQTYPYWECIIVDDGSTDNTKEMAQRYCAKDNRFKYVYQSNQGLSSARNTGISKASGMYIQLLDADDLIEADKLKQQTSFLNNNPDVGIVFGDSLFFQDFSTQRIFTPCPYPDEKQIYEILLNDFKTALIVKNRIPVCVPLIRKHIFNELGTFDTNLYSCEDWDFWLRCVYSNITFKYLSQNNTKALIRQTENSMRANEWKMSFYEIVVRKKNEPSLNKAQRKINDSQINDRIKTALYSIANQKDKKIKIAHTQLLIKQMRCYKIRIFGLLINLLPSAMHNKLVWTLFENKINAIKSKIK